MLKRLVRILLMLIGISLGGGVAQLTLTLLSQFGMISQSSAYFNLFTIVVYIAGLLLGIVISLLFSRPLIHTISSLLHNLEAVVQRTPVEDIFFGTVGLVLGLVIAYLITRLFSNVTAWISIPVGVGVYLIFAYLGFTIGQKRWREIPMLRKVADREVSVQEASADIGCAKILDTSSIIDGRIYDLCKSGFIEGTLIIPEFVLRELRHIADSTDVLRRNRGRRGLDVLSRLQKENLPVVVDGRDFPEEAEVDIKLLRLAEVMQGKVVTNDYNLNKVAEVTGTGVLNINELANALKPVMLPGEEMSVLIVREGKEAGQGVAYLDDGTMIVVDNARRKIGSQVSVQVTSVLQTAAGRMIFAKAAGA